MNMSGHLLFLCTQSDHFGITLVSIWCFSREGGECLDKRVVKYVSRLEEVLILQILQFNVDS